MEFVVEEHGFVDDKSIKLLGFTVYLYVLSNWKKLNQFDVNFKALPVFIYFYNTLSVSPHTYSPWYFPILLLPGKMT